METLTPLFTYTNKGKIKMRILSEMLSKNLSKKGISAVVAKLLGVLIYIGFLVAFVVMFISGYLDIHEIVQEATVERHAINLGQSLLAYPRLTYIDENFVHRGVFDKSKIEQQLQDGSELTEEIGYPNSIIFIGIRDYKNSWNPAIKYKGPEIFGGLAYDYIKCLWDEAIDSVNPTMVFQQYLLWTQYELDECESIATSKFGTSTKVFPILIRDDEGDSQIYPAALYVTVKEAFSLEAIFGI